MEEVEAISKFLGLNKDMRDFEEVVEKTRFDVMKGHEQPALVDNPMVNRQEGIYRKGKVSCLALSVHYPLLKGCSWVVISAG